MHLNERAVGFDHLAHRAPGRGVGGDGRADGNAAVLGNFAGDIADALDVDVAVLFREPQFRRQMFADDIAVQQRHRASAHFHQLDHHRIGDSGFT